jgi:hypothetical protein
VKAENIIGWRLDLVRNCVEWQGSQVLVAKAEFFELIAKTELSTIPVNVYLYLDSHTANKYYESWLEESGLALNELVTCLRIEINHSDISDEKEYLERWYKCCCKFIDEQTKKLDSTADKCPIWLLHHQHSQYDSILPIYF